MVDGKEGTRTINTLTRKIDVKIGWPETADEWFDYMKKMIESASWLWATILLPIGAYAVHRWKIFRNGRTPATETEVDSAIE